MNILEQILVDKQNEVNQNLKHLDESLIEKNQHDDRTPLDFKGALKKETLAIIAEVKKASPSKGLIRPDFDPVAIAKTYEQHQADCLSVLTEEKYFQGHPSYLKKIRQEVSTPLLRKDFIVDRRQIREAYDLGADAILLIVAALPPVLLEEFFAIATGFGLTCLVEVHTHQELEIALALNSDLIGINNRNLTTFETDLKNSIELKKEIPESIITVSESGIHQPEDCALLWDNGFNAVLVGENLMRQSDPGVAIDLLMKRVR